MSAHVRLLISDENFLSSPALKSDIFGFACTAEHVKNPHRTAVKVIVGAPLVPSIYRLAKLEDLSLGLGFQLLWFMPIFHADL